MCTIHSILHSVLILNLKKTGNISEASENAQACVTFSNPFFATQFQISPSVGRPNDSVVELGNFSMVYSHCAFINLFCHVTATPGVDYGDVIASITASPGDTEACFNVTIVNDKVGENLECFIISFTALTKSK